MPGRNQLNLRSSVALSIAFFIIFISACSSSTSDDTQARISAVEKNLIPAIINEGTTPAGLALTDRMQHFQVPGFSIAVINNGAVEWAKGYGVTEAGGTQAVTADTVFQASSVSKPVSVTGIMLLAQSGAIDISRNVNDYLVSWKLADNEFTVQEKATIQRLMSHTAGVNVDGFSGYDAGGAIPTLLQVLNGTLPATSDPVRVIYTPGERYSYSGGGMEVLQQMAEDVSGMPFRSYMKSSLFDRLEMSSSDFVQPLSGPLEVRAAKGHDIDGVTVAGGWKVYPELIAAGLWTTPADLARLWVEVQRAISGNGTLLTRETAAQILTQQPNAAMGLGFALVNGRGGLIFNHSGSTFGFKSYATAYRDRGQGVVVMANGDNGYALNMEAIRAVAKVYGWPDEGVTAVRLVEVPLATLQSYEGSYTGTYSGVAMQVRIYLRDGSLMCKASIRGTGSGADLFPAAADTFLLKDNTIINGTIVFSTDGSGNQILTIYSADGATVVATRQ